MKIVKSSKRVSPPHPEVTVLITKLCDLPTDDLAAFISTISEWRWPRSDLGNWVNVLDKFDAILKDIIRDYDVDKLQVNPFTPLTKATVLEILRFERMLLENSTGRKLYASYDRLNSLLFSSDLDVVVADLKVILRPSQQYSSQPPSAQTTNIASTRLTSLAQSWPILRDQGIELHDLMDAKKVPVEVDLSNDAGDIHFQFYRKPTEATSKPAGESAPATDAAPSSPTTTIMAAPSVTPAVKVDSGATSVHLSGVAISEKDAMTLLAEAVEKYDIPQEERFALLCKIRIIKVMQKGEEGDRQKLLVARLLAIAIYAHTHSENHAMNTLFLYDPELVNHIAELVHPDRDIPSTVQVAALIALDALGRYRSKISEVLAAVNAGVSHGILLSLLRKTVTQLREPTASVPSELAETLLSLLMLLTSSPGGGTMVVGAGLIPLMVQVLDMKDPARLSVISKTTVLLDNVLYGISNAFQLFCTHSGVEALVHRISHEVETDIQDAARTTETPVTGATPGGISYARASVLKHLLRSMHRMMQSSGTHEGLRTLIDSSLPKSVQQIMANRLVFGPPIFSLAINLMSLFVHNEPTSLSILQEAHIPETFYDAIESGIEPALEVISALPNAIGALCLNAAGEAQLAARINIIPSIFETFTSEKHIKVLGEKENAVIIGTAMDELVRHHPALKPRVFEGIKNMLEKIEDLGKSWSPPKAVESAYQLRSGAADVPSSSGAEAAAASSEGMDVEDNERQEALPTQDESAAEDKDDQLFKAEDNIVLSFVEVAAKLLEGLFQYAPHCRDFIVNHEGIDLLGRILRTPAIPIRFSESGAGEAVIQIFRTMAELNNKETLTKLSELARSALDESREYWQATGVESKLTGFNSASTAADIESLNTAFRKLITLQVILCILGDVYQSVGYSHARTSTSVLQVLCGKDAPDIIEDLGKVHRFFLWENILLKNVQTDESLESPAPGASTETESSNMPSNRPSDIVVADLPNPQAALQSSKKTVNDNSAASTNSRAVAYVAAQIPLSLTPFFQAVSKLFMSGRRSDGASKTLSNGLAQSVASVLLEHCRWDTSGDEKSTFAYGTLVISFITALLRDERTPQNSLHTMLLVVFNRQGGVDAVMSFGRSAVALIQQIVERPAEARSKSEEITLSYAYGLLNVAVHLLGIVVSSRPLLESAQTAPLVTRDKDVRDVEYFEPHNFLVKMRFRILPFLRELWQSSWVVGAPLPAVKSILSAIVEIMTAENEIASPETTPEAPIPSIHTLHAQLRQTNAPDEAAITQLVDMGFPRSSAERALTRTRNNINAAADLLISHPHLFPAMPSIPAAPVVPVAVAVPAAVAEPEPVMATDNAPADNVAEPIDAPAAPVPDLIGEEGDMEGVSVQNAEPEVPMAEAAVEAEAEVVEPVEETLAPVLEPAREWKVELDEARDNFHDDVIHRAFVLVDKQPALVFEVKIAFVRLGNLKGDSGLSSVMQVDADASDEVIAVRCRLLALILNDPTFPVTQIPIGEVQKVMELVANTLQRLPADARAATSLPKWLPSHLLATEALLLLGDGIVDVAVPTPEQEVPSTKLPGVPAFQDERNSVFDTCLRLLAVKDLPRDEMLATLRLLVLLTRDYEKSALLIARGGVQLLLDVFKGSKDSLAYRTSILMVLRHAVEDAVIVEALMKLHLKRYFALSRNRMMEVGTMVRNTSPLSLRDPATYLAVCKSTCRITLPLRQGSVSYNVTLLAEDATNAPIDTPAKGLDTTADAMQIDEPQKPTTKDSSAESLIHYIMGELLRTMKAPRAAPAASSPTVIKPTGSLAPDSEGVTGDPSSPGENSDDYVYACVLMQTLAELLASYDICKTAFISFHKRKSSGSKHRPAFLPFLLIEVVGAQQGSSGDPNPQKASLSAWATSIVTALCTDIYATTNVKDASDALTSTRKFVLDTLSKAMKDISTSDAADTRYNKIHGLAELCYRLLSTQATTQPGAKEETNIHVAKIMLEKNFVAILTGALADADLNYPGMKSLVGVIMRPMEHLTKVAIKMGKASSKAKEGMSDHMDTDSSSAEEDEASDREETPDLYRNSSLGMFGGEMEDVEYGGDDPDEMDADDDDDDDEEMEYGDDDSSGTEPSTEDEVDDAQVDQMDVGMQGSGDDGWADEMGEDGEGTDEDGEDDADNEIIEADAEIIWQGNPDDQAAQDAIDVNADEGEERLDEEGSVISAEDEGEPETPSEEAFILEYPDAMAVPEDGGWMIAPTWGGGPPVDVVDHRHGVSHSRRNRMIAVSDSYTFGGSGRRQTTFGDAVAHPLLVEQPEPSSPEPLATGARNPYRRLTHNGVVAPGGGYVDVVQAFSDLVGGEGAQILQQLLVHGRHAAPEALRIELGRDAGTILQTIERGLSRGNPAHQGSGAERRSRNQPQDVARFIPQGTLQRWADESKLMNPTLVADRVMKLANQVAVVLLPAAHENAKVAKAQAEKAEAEKKRQEEIKAVEDARAAEEAKAAKEASDLAEREEQLKAEEERAAASRQAEIEAEAAALAAAATAAETASAMPSTEDVVMEDATVPGQSDPHPPVADDSTVAAPTANDAPSGSAQERVTVLVHGNPVDITDSGIDVTFLEALPDDMREEIINQHFRERTSAQAQPMPDSQISPEFLDALPPDIRAEILHQEVSERTRRERAEAVAGQPAAPAGPSDIDTASFLASLDPGLRQAVLMEQDEGFLQTLPSALLAEVNVNTMAAARRQAAARTTATNTANAQPPPPKKPSASRDAVQLLDKSGVGTLVRLLFTPHTHKRGSIHKVLVNLCENSKTRTEVLNLLLTLLQSGTADLSAVDKSFSQMSVRGTRVQTPKSTPRKPTLETGIAFLSTATENIPNLVAQRCLEALASLVTSNELCSLFFLAEHELPSGLKRSMSKKGKGKEKSVAQTHYPIVLLLGLLDKPTILKTPSLMDLVAALLSSVTRPLTTLKEDSPDAVPVPGSSQPLTVGDVASPAVEQEIPITGVVPAPTQSAEPAPSLPEDQTKLLVSPPQIPHSVLRLVVNILTAGECSGRTFQQTLSLIQHLSSLPDARDTIASELRSKAQELGQNLYSDLSDLVTALESSSTDVSNAVITKFSPASSDQAKLLRVLKTIDYMYTSKPTSVISTEGVPKSDVTADDQEKAQAIYQAFRFNSLWNKLGDCLAIVSEKSETDHIATVLLPLIESLMVVCKYVSGVGMARRTLRESMSPRSPTTPRESTEDLFVAFTDTHRKILNSMVRNNPSLMSGSFSLLVNNPRVLDFDNKRNYFTQKLRRRPANREQYGTLQVNVRRQRVFEDSFQHLQRSSGEQIKYGKLSVRFYDEEGVDAGGVTREWFQILARQMFNPDYALFQPCAADRLTYQPNQASWVNSEHLSFFKFVGRIIGKAIFDGRLLDAYFARSLYRQLLGKPVDYRDVEWVDPEYYKSLVWILENDPTILDLTFSVESNAFGLTKTVPLKESGHTIAVTNDNKREYVQLSAEYRLVLSIKEQIEAFLNGFYEIIPKELIAIFNEQELELLISGTPDIDVDEWKGATDYTGYTAADPVIVWWWRALKSFNRDERAKVLSFATGTSKVPLGGFTELQGVQGVQRFAIHKAYGDLDRLPSAHTCFNQIDLPQYTSYEKLRTQLLLAINEGGEGFGFA